MPNFDRGGFKPRGRGGFQSRGRSFGNDRGGFQSRDREMFKAVCDNCGKDCEVPFRPTSGKPVYCSDCFEKMGGGSERTERRERPERREFRAPAPRFNQDKLPFDALNAKLDKILKLLEPTKPAANDGVEVKAKRVKKVAE